MSKQSSNPKIRKTVFDKFNGHCAYCGCEISFRKFNIDHIIPRRRHCGDYSKMGENSIENYNPSCQSCNFSKSTFSIEQWRNELSLKLSRLNRDSSTFCILKRFGVVKEVKTQIIFYFEKVGNDGK
jgi:hypothetical protein